jgi:hypothetical protein
VVIILLAAPGSTALFTHAYLFLPIVVDRYDFGPGILGELGRVGRSAVPAGVAVGVERSIMVHVVIVIIIVKRVHGRQRQRSQVGQLYRAKINLILEKRLKN